MKAAVSAREPGDWQGLDRPDRRSRYEAVAEAISTWSPGLVTLDVGCGEGTLGNYLPGVHRLFGVEPSDSARQFPYIKRLYRAVWKSGSGIGVGFDAIAFNESIYYLDDPIASIRFYAATLNPNGVIITSIFQDSRIGVRKFLCHCLDRKRPYSNVHCSRMLDAFYAREGWEVLEQRMVENRWELTVVRPR